MSPVIGTCGELPTVPLISMMTAGDVRFWVLG
jgi:hypothetical protein